MRTLVGADEPNNERPRESDDPVQRTLERLRRALESSRTLRRAPQ